MNQPEDPRQQGGRHAKPERPEPDLDAPTVNLRPGRENDNGFYHGFSPNQQRLIVIACYTVGSVLIAILVIAAVRSLAEQSSGSGSSSSPTAYQQGYSYGKSLDNGGYGDNQSYVACRDASQSQPSAQDIEAFQLGCDIGYAQ